MEFLFSNQFASAEAIIIFICLGLLGLFLIYDTIVFLSKKLGIITARQQYLKEKNGTDISPIAESIITEKLDEIHAHQSEEHTDHSLDDILPESQSDEIPEETPAEVELPEFLQLTPEEQKEEDRKHEELEESVEAEAIVPQIDTTAEVPTLDTDSPISAVTTDDTPSERESEPTREESTTQDQEIILLEEYQTGDASMDIQEAEVIELEAPPSRGELSPNTPQEDPQKNQLNERPEPTKREKITENIAIARTLLARNMFIEARSVIIEGLSLDKKNKDLNILLASLYERDRAYEKAEFIYKDIAESAPNDIEILTHLADVLAMQHKYKISYELYKKIREISGENEENMYALIHLAMELDETEDVYQYARSYIKQFPKNPEVLWIYSQAQLKLGKRREAIETLIKLKNLTPYNQEILDLIQKLVTEEELAGNF